MDVVKQLKEIVDVLNKINRSVVNSTSPVYSETPAGTIDGSNKVFTLSNIPISGSLQLFLNGMYMTGSGEDYHLSSLTITFINAPVPGSVLRSFFSY